MSKMRKLIMIVMVVLVSCLLIAMTFEVKATDGSDPVSIGGNGLDLTLGDENETTTEPDLNTTQENTTVNNTQVIQPDTNVTENTTDKLPQTGVTEDITVMFFIVVCAVSAIYAYKKIRDYNV